MTHQRIPPDWTIQRSTPFFTPETVPRALLTHHSTAEGVFGQICVMEGRVTYFGFADREATKPERTVVLEAGQFTTTPPEYWHRVELSADARFNINFWSAGKREPGALFRTKKDR